MVRLLLEDVTLLQREQILVHVRFKGGAIQSLSLPLPLSAPALRKTPAAVIPEVESTLRSSHRNRNRPLLNEKGLRAGTGQAFTPMMVINVRRNQGLLDRFQRMRETPSRRWPNGSALSPVSSRTGAIKVCYSHIATMTKVNACAKHPRKICRTSSKRNAFTWLRRHPALRLRKECSVKRKPSHFLGQGGKDER